MVDVFKYKHISSLTTHLKRHFKMNVHYRRFSQEQNKRVWTYFITVDCFIGICEYVRHAARKKIANVWLRKVGIKGSARRVVREHEEYPELSEEEEDLANDDEVEGEAQGPEYEYYIKESSNKRSMDEDEEYQCEEDEEDDPEERTYFQEMEEEEEAAAEYESDESTEYDSSSSHAESPLAATVRPFATRQYGTPRRFLVRSSSLNSPNDSSTSSSPSSSAPSSPASESPEPYPAPHSNCSPVMPSRSAFVPLTPSAITPLPSLAPAAAPAPAPLPAPAPEIKVRPEPIATASDLVTGLIPAQDWSYLHLRPNPHPLAIGMNDYSSKYFTHLLFPHYYNYPQVTPYSYYISPTSFFSNCYPIHFQSVMLDPTGLMRVRHDGDNHVGDYSNKEGQFDTNVFLSLPEEQPYPQYHSHHGK
jgi:hypothetical protein